jgi:hypothetical protein
MKIKSRIASHGWHARLRPSPAMLVAVAALFVALGSVGYAATTIGSEEIRNNSLQSVDVKNDDLLSRDIHDGTILSRDVTDDTILSRDVQDDTLLQRDIDPEALIAFKGPRAFAHVTDSLGGSVRVDEANSKGIVQANVSNPSTGLYCFDNLGFNPKIAIATPDFGTPGLGPAVDAARAFADRYVDCPGGAQTASVTLTLFSNELRDGAFYVMFE